MLSLFSSRDHQNLVHNFLRTLAETTCPNSCPGNQCIVDCKCTPQSECPKDLTLVIMIAAGIATLLILVGIAWYLCSKERKGNRMPHLAVQGRTVNRADENNLAPINTPVLGNTQENLNAVSNPKYNGVPNPNQMNTTLNQYINIKLITDNSSYINNNPQSFSLPQPHPQALVNSQGNVRPDLDASALGLINKNNQSHLGIEETEQEKALNKSAFKDLSQIHEDHNMSNIRVKTESEANDFSMVTNKPQTEAMNYQQKVSMQKSIINDLSDMLAENNASNIPDNNDLSIINKLQAETIKDPYQREKSLNNSYVSSQRKEEHETSNIIIHKTPLNILDKFEILETKTEHLEK